MPTSAYVVTGFLEAGKTTFINRLLADRAFAQEKALVVQFESGEEALNEERPDLLSLRFSKRWHPSYIEPADPSADI
jgi:G3E family GTPase